MYNNRNKTNYIRRSAGQPDQEKEEKLRRAELELLSLLAESDELSWAIQMALLKIMETTVFPSGAIRLVDGENYSYIVQESLVQESLPDNFCWRTVPENEETRTGQCFLEQAVDDKSEFIYKSNYGTILSGKSAELGVGKLDSSSDFICRKCLLAGFQTIIAVPLKAGHEMVGILYLHDQQADKLERQTLMYLESVAQSIAYVIKNLQSRQELQASYEKIHSLSVKLLHAYEEERSRLARELHDEIGQALTAVKLNLQLLDKKFTKELLALEGMLKESIDLLNEMVRNVRVKLFPCVRLLLRITGWWRCCTIWS